MIPGTSPIGEKGSSVPPEPPFQAMVWIPGGTFTMGSDHFYPEERPAHRATVAGFWMDAYLLTNSDFGRFVEATGYITAAERVPDPRNYPDANPALLVPGSLVFRKPRQRVSLRDHRAWWAYVPGASWRHPEGPGSNLDGREQHPVVHVAYEDAATYAAWAGKTLPTEAEWEFAARGGLEGAIYVWGDEFTPGGWPQANTWQGEFPLQNLKTDGYEGTCPSAASRPTAMDCTTWRATSGNGRAIPSQPIITVRTSRRAVRPALHAWSRQSRPTKPANRA